MSTRILTPARTRLCQPCALASQGTRLGTWNSFTLVTCPECRSKHSKGIVVQTDLVDSKKPRGWRAERT